MLKYMTYNSENTEGEDIKRQSWEKITNRQTTINKTLNVYGN